MEKPADAQPMLVGSDLGLGGKLGKVVTAAPAGTGKGQIDPNAAPGYLGIPGGKQITLIVAFVWPISSSARSFWPWDGCRSILPGST